MTEFQVPNNSKYLTTSSQPFSSANWPIPTTYHLLFTLLPIVTKTLLYSIVLLHTLFILAMLTRHVSLLPLTPLNPQIRTELDRPLSTLRQFVRPLVRCDRRAVFLLILPRTKRSVPRNRVRRLPSLYVSHPHPLPSQPKKERNTNLVVIFKPKFCTDSLVKFICRNYPRPILMHPQPILVTLFLALQIFVLVILQLRFAPRVRGASEIDAEVWVCDEPVVDLAAVHGVLAEGEARRVARGGGVGKIGTSGAGEGEDAVLPICGEGAGYVWSGEGGGESEGGEEGGEERSHDGGRMRAWVFVMECELA
jgi:hypothetical protein